MSDKKPKDDKKDNRKETPPKDHKKDDKHRDSDDDKKSDDGRKKDKHSDDGDHPVKHDVDDKLSEKQQKQVNQMIDRMNKVSTNMESYDKKMQDNAKNLTQERKMFLKEIETMKKELDPYIEKDKEKMGKQVKEEVENALLVIMEKKYAAEQEVTELKALLRDRNQKIYELEKENKHLRDRNFELEEIMNGGTGRARQSTQKHMNEAMQSQENFDRADDYPVYDQPPSQDDEDDFWQEGKANKGGYGGGDNDLWIMGKKDNLPANNLNSYSAQSSKAQPPGGFKSLPKRAQGYNANDDMAFYGVSAKKN